MRNVVDLIYMFIWIIRFGMFLTKVILIILFSGRLLVLC